VQQLPAVVHVVAFWCWTSPISMVKWARLDACDLSRLDGDSDLAGWAMRHGKCGVERYRSGGSLLLCLLSDQSEMSSGMSVYCLEIE
jgi:hypothetical protein